MCHLFNNVKQQLKYLDQITVETKIIILCALTVTITIYTAILVIKRL